MKMDLDEGEWMCDAHMLMCGGVYAILDEDQNVLYIGQSENLMQRFGEHCSKSRNAVPRKLIHTFIVLEYIGDKSDRLIAEEGYIEQYFPRYGGGGGSKVYKQQRNNVLANPKVNIYKIRELRRQGIHVKCWENVYGLDTEESPDEDERIVDEFLKANPPKIKGENPMQELYNCKLIDSKHYKITKFDRDLNPKRDHTGRTSSYVVSELGCDCPQGHAKSCRHRKMLPFFLEHHRVNTEYFFVWDTHQWYKPLSGPEVTDEHWHVPGVPAYGPGIIQDDVVSEPEGGNQSPVSAAPSPQPSSKVYRRF